MEREVRFVNVVRDGDIYMYIYIYADMITYQREDFPLSRRSDIAIACSCGSLGLIDVAESLAWVGGFVISYVKTVSCLSHYQCKH